MDGFNLDGVNLDGLNLRGKRITVVGAGISGRELALMARRLGAHVFVSEAGPVSAAASDLFGRSGIDIFKKLKLFKTTNRAVRA